MIGFGVVFVLACALMSALAAGVLGLARPWLRRLGPQVERRAAELAAIVPVALAITLVAVLIARAELGVDHCAGHDHHAHLCVAHGAAWASRPWAIALIAGAAAVVLGRLVVLAAAIARGRAAVARLRSVSRIADGVHVVDSPRAFCFVAGIHRPEVFASTAAWHQLADDERAAVLAHERGHVHGDDLGRRLGLELLLGFAAPLAPGLVRHAWDDATERLRDADAARAVGGEAVARAIVHMCRLGAARLMPGVVAFTPARRTLTERVEALLADPIDGGPAARRMAWSALGAGALVAGVMTTLSGSLHHALETLLG